MNPTRAAGVRIYAAAVLSVMTALIMTVLPTPAWVIPFWPEWPILVIIYWCLYLPQHFNLGFAWVTGLLMDVIKGSLLGQYALAYLLVAYVCIHTHRRLRMYSLPQQALLIGLLLLPYFMLCLWIDSTHQPVVINWRYFASIITSMILWPWIFSILRLAGHRTAG